MTRAPDPHTVVRHRYEKIVAAMLPPVERGA